MQVGGATKHPDRHCTIRGSDVTDIAPVLFVRPEMHFVFQLLLEPVKQYAVSYRSLRI